MSESIDFITDRATKTIAAARELAAAGSWTWQEKTPDEMQAALDAVAGQNQGTPVTGQEEITEEKEQAMLAARGLWDTAIDQLHRWTVQGVGMAKTRFRHDKAKAKQLAKLEARGTSRREALDEALAWEVAWEAVDPAWAPLPTIKLDSFKALRGDCNGKLKSDYANARAGWRGEAEKLGQMAADLEDMNVAWYADATRAFVEGTPQGDMIRGTIPTTYDPAAPAPIPPLTP